MHLLLADFISITSCSFSKAETADMKVSAPSCRTTTLIGENVGQKEVDDVLISGIIVVQSVERVRCILKPESTDCDVCTATQRSFTGNS